MTPERVTPERLAGIVAATTFAMRPPEGNPSLPLPRMGEVHAIASELARLRERLERLRPLEAAATPGPWHEQPIGIVFEMFDNCGVEPETPDGYRFPVGRDANFIALARNEIAAMLEETKP